MLDRARRTTRFGRCEVIHDRRELLVNGLPVPLGSRAFDILELLVEARGMLVTKDEILRKVWAGVVVEENNLQVHMSALRKALGTDRGLIKTVSGRGYRLLISSDAGTDSAGHSSATNLPEPASELIGRDQALADVLGQVAAHRIVTLTGLGGIGKTRIAVEAARQLLPKFSDGAWLAELAPLARDDLVLDTVATALGIEFAGAAPSLGRLVKALGSKQVLLVLDNCEHVIDRAAETAEAVVRANPNGRVLATSREPLRAEGEWTYPVPPLEVPAADTPNLPDWRHRGAVGLFFARALAVDPSFAANASRIALVGAVCRRLDGIPLAIELAASRAATLGLTELAGRLDDRFNLLTGGRRTAMPRQQTLRATLDWSYTLLSESERTILQRAAIFVAGFTLDAAIAVAGHTGMAPSDVINGIAALSAKALIASDDTETVPRWRMLETTRAYALEKLTESGDFELVAGRHAEYYRDLFARAEAEANTRPGAEWLPTYRRELDNLRAALDWAFSTTGDVSIGIALMAASLPLWFQLSLLVECRRRIGAAIASPPSRLHSRPVMQLHAALGIALLNTAGPAHETDAALTEAFDLAERLDDVDYQLRVLWGMWTRRFNNGENRAARAVAERFLALAAGASDPSDRLVGERLMGTALHYLGDQAGARWHLEEMLNNDAAPRSVQHTVRFQFDQRVLARAMFARVLWVQGLPDQAMHAAESSLDDARASGHTLSLCYALAEASCPIPLMSGELAVAERCVGMLLDVATRHAPTFWENWGRCLEGALLIRRGELVTGSQVLRAALAAFRETGWAMRSPEFLGILAEGLAGAGQIADASAMVDAALTKAERDEERWCFAELLRVRAELLLHEGGGSDRSAAETGFLQALDWARRQDALSWELRAATGLARFWHGADRQEEARHILAPVYDRFTEGFETTDLKAAKALLHNLG
ncbi:MAG TPA: winged helix-turn-helix domain-containing protein [Acetobacteraceae bacterium]|nr:winged helix-turn-helix domain-containing protein [Acetobacteraceae bacterium]